MAPGRRYTPVVCQCRKLRMERGLSQPAVAAAVGISKTGYWHIEQGGNVNIDTAILLSRFFGKSIEELWQLKPHTLAVRA